MASSGSYFRDDKITQVLINKGADVNVKDKWGKTALFLAKSQKLVEVIQYLEHDAE